MKPVFQILFALILIAAVGALILSFSLDGIVKSNIESTTSEMLDTSVEVNDVSISILDGEGTIDGITIHNPEGFSDRPAIQLKQIHMKIDLSSLLSDTMIVEELRIQQPELYVEQSASGNNLNALNQELQTQPPSETSMIVDYLLVSDGRVTLTADIGKEKTVEGEFSKIEIEGIGRQGNNTMEQTIKQILEPILQKALQEAVEQGLMDRAKEKAKDALENLLNGN